eukprot:4474540-Pleurochrysis_carterae.AAC.1
MHIGESTSNEFDVSLPMVWKRADSRERTCAKAHAIEEKAAGLMVPVAKRRRNQTVGRER